MVDWLAEGEEATIVVRLGVNVTQVPIVVSVGTSPCYTRAQGVAIASSIAPLSLRKLAEYIDV